MDKCFQLQRFWNLRPNRADFSQRQFTGQDDPPGALLMPKPAALRIGDISLCTDMDRHIGRSLAHECENTRIRDNDRIGTRCRKVADLVAQHADFLLVGEDVQGQINADIAFMGVMNRFLQTGQSKVACRSAQAKILDRQINRISTILDGCAQFLRITGRGKQFKPVHVPLRLRP